MFRTRHFTYTDFRRWLQLLVMLVMVLESFYGPVGRAGAGPLSSVSAGKLQNSAEFQSPLNAFFNDLAGFNTAAGSPPIVESFDDLAPGLDITGAVPISGIIFDLGNPERPSGALVNGAMLEMGSLAWISALQEYVPHERLGRVANIDSLGSFALIPIGYGLTGWATELLGAPMVFLLGGSITAIIAAIGLCHPAVRQLD